MLHINITQQLGTFSLNLNVDIPSHGVTAIFGRSGAGKSSLINLVAGLAKPQSGQISLNGRVLFDSQTKINLAPEKRNIGYVFQEHRLFPHYTVEKNLKYGCKRSDPAKFLQIVELLGIGHLLARFPSSLSGGEKQRVAIGRALLAEPDILLMDEPLSALDQPRKKELLAYLSRLAKQLAIPILYVSHSLDEVVKLADYLLLLENGQVTAFDRTATVWQSEAFSAWQASDHKINLLEVTVDEWLEYQDYRATFGSQSIGFSSEKSCQIGESLRLMLDSRDLAVWLEKPSQSSIHNNLFGQICKIQRKNDRLFVAVEVENQPIWANISRRAFDELNLAEGLSVYLQIQRLSL